MSVGVGDVIALVGLVERVANEIRQYRDAPAHFQQAFAELHFFQATLSRLLKMESDDGEDEEWLGLIRASAIRCQQPIVKFLDKMKPKESLLGLGNRGTTLSLTAVKHRLHWSMIARKDLEDLREVVTTTIIMLVGMQQMSDIRKALHQRPIPVDPQMQDFFSRSTKFYEESANLLTLPKDLESLKVTVSRESSEQKALSKTMSKRIEEVSLTSNDLSNQNMHILIATDTISETLARSGFTLIAIAHDIKRIISVLGAFSREVLARIAANGQLLLGIHTMLKRLLRTVEAIPLHLSLRIVRLDDAMGESWALPYQACQTLASFKDILQVVVFGNNRVGARYVHLDKILLRSAKDGIVLNETNWSALVTQGSHVSQAVVLDHKRLSRKSCPFPGCRGLVRIEGGQCATCGKHSSYERVGNDRLDLLGINSGSSSNHVETITKPSNLVPLGPMRMEDHTLEDETLFRNVHYQEMREPITSIEEAYRILSEDPEDLSALRYTACFRLSQQDSEDPPYIHKTLDLLEKAVSLERVLYIRVCLAAFEARQR